MTKILRVLPALALLAPSVSAKDYSAEQLAKWLERFPEADANDDGTLTSEEADAFRKKMQQDRSGGAPRVFEVDPGWDEPDFPGHAVSKKSPGQIAVIYGEKSEADLTEEIFDRIGTEKRELYAGLIETLREKHGDRVFILPTSDAMTLAAKRYLRGELPGVEGINLVLGGKEKSLWRDTLGHLGPGFERLEGYVFYATIYGKSPELIEGDIPFGNSPKMNQSGYPSEELDRIFRKIAWEAVSGHRFSGVKDGNGDGKADAAD